LHHHRLPTPKLLWDKSHSNFLRKPAVLESQDGWPKPSRLTFILFVPTGSGEPEPIELKSSGQSSTPRRMARLPALAFRLLFRFQGAFGFPEGARCGGPSQLQELCC